MSERGKVETMLTESEKSLKSECLENRDAEEKKKELFRNQKILLDTFLEHGAISWAQYDKSLGDLIIKMGISEESCRSE